MLDDGASSLWEIIFIAVLVLFIFGSEVVTAILNRRHNRGFYGEASNGEDGPYVSLIGFVMGRRQRVEDNPGADPLAVKPRPVRINREPFAIPARISQLLQHYKAHWAVAGGWALDIHLGEVTRDHSDIEVATFRHDQEILWHYLIGWKPHYVDNERDHRRLPWVEGKRLDLPIHEIDTSPPQSDVDKLEFLLNETEGNTWVYRRDPTIRLPLSRAILQNEYGIPYLAPEIVLLYKSKGTRPRDHQDFNAVIDQLDFEQQQWLKDAIELTSPGHVWLNDLE